MKHLELVCKLHPGNARALLLSNSERAASKLGLKVTDSMPPPLNVFHPVAESAA